MNCRFCGAEARTDYGYQCGSGPNPGQRSHSCWQREVGRLRIRVADLDDEAHDWREYAEALEIIGDGMKHTASACDAVKWNNRRARKPEPCVPVEVKEVQP
jgi:hypothetical protein